MASSLPVQPTSFIGRSQELDTIAWLLADPQCRLLTLLEPGGIGKTRLALAVAASETAAFGDGVAFVALVPIGTPNQIVLAIGDALGLSFARHADPTAHLLGYLRERHMLLVLDNFEHLLAGADLLATILERAPHLTLLVTSRARLNLQTEWLFDVDGLGFPQEDPHGSAVPQSLAVGPRLMVAAALEGLASVMVVRGCAELVLAGATALCAEMGTPVRPVDQSALEQTLVTARSTLDDDAFAAVWAEAQALAPEQILSTIPSTPAFATLGDR